MRKKMLMIGIVVVVIIVFVFGGMVHSVYQIRCRAGVSVFGSKEVGRVAGRDARSGGEPAYGAC